MLSEQGGIKYLVWINLELNPGLPNHWRTLTIMLMDGLYINMRQHLIKHALEKDYWLIVVFIYKTFNGL